MRASSMIHFPRLDGSWDTVVGNILILLFIPDSAIQIDAIKRFSHVTLWIISIYALMFDETWLRIRGKMPGLDYESVIN